MCLNPVLWAVEWSAMHQKFHVDKLDKLVAKNLSDCIKGKNLDFIIIGLFEDGDKALNFAEQISDEKGIQYSLVVDET